MRNTKSQTPNPKKIQIQARRESSLCPCVSRLRRLKFGTWGFRWDLDFGVWDFLGGCSVGPNYHRPSVAASGEWSEPLKVAQPIETRSRPNGDDLQRSEAEFSHCARRAIKYELAHAELACGSASSTTIFHGRFLADG